MFRRRTLTRLMIAAAAVQAGTAAAIVAAGRLRGKQAAVRGVSTRQLQLEPVPVGDAGSAQLLVEGARLLDELIAAIDEAERRVLLETFILVTDWHGMRVVDALERAIRRGVQVHVIVDPLLSSDDAAVRLRRAGARVLCFRAARGLLPKLHPRQLVRDHRKIVVVDDDVAFIGGFNLGGEYLRWRDTHIALRGPAVGELANAFVDFWNEHRGDAVPPLPDTEPRSWDSRVAVHRNDPALLAFPIRGMMLEALDRAEQRMWLTMGYFVPDPRFRRAMARAVERGVDVRVLVPARSNHPLVDALSHGMWDELLQSGVRLFRYLDGMLHAKTVTADGVWATIGTANIDRLSMLGNYEINLELRSSALAAQLEQIFERDLELSEEVLLDDWRRRPLTHRLSEFTVRRFEPLV